MSLYIIIYIATHTYTVVRSEFIVCNTRLCTSLRGLYKYVQAMHFGGQARAVQFSPVHTSLTHKKSEIRANVISETHMAIVSPLRRKDVM